MKGVIYMKIRGVELQRVSKEKDSLIVFIEKVSLIVSIEKDNLIVSI